MLICEHGGGVEAAAEAFHAERRHRPTGAEGPHSRAAQVFWSSLFLSSRTATAPTVLMPARRAHGSMLTKLTVRVVWVFYGSVYICHFLFPLHSHRLGLCMILLLNLEITN